MRKKMSFFTYFLIFIVSLTSHGNYYFVNGLSTDWPLNRSVEPISNYSKIFDIQNTDYTVNSLTGIQQNIPPEVSLSQLNEDDLISITTSKLVIKNDTLFKAVTDNFLNSQANYIDTVLCKELQDATQSKSAEEITSLYYPGLSKFESIRCVPGDCKIASLWNSTNQNGSKFILFKF